MSRAIAKVFASGRSQAVRLPKAFRFTTDEVYVERRGKQLILTPKPISWDDYFNKDQPSLSADFPDDIEDTSAEERESYW